MKQLICYFVGGAIFGAGLCISGMTQPEVVSSFLLFEDFGLALVMGGAIAVTLPFFQLVKKPLLEPRVEGFKASLNAKTATGSILFGLGWGISGVCPGAALASLGTLNTPVSIAVVAMFLGAYLQGVVCSTQPQSGS